MKILFFFLLLSSKIAFSSSAFPFCSTYYAPSLAVKAWKISSYDKFLHCSVSCMLVFRCGYFDALEMGIVKETIDLFTPGNADINDLKANKYGLDLAVRGQAQDDDDCLLTCDRRYP